MPLRKQKRLRESETPRKPGELFVEKSRRGTFGEETYGVYIQGDETLEGQTITLGIFSSYTIAQNFIDYFKSSPELESIRERMFRHPDKMIAIDQRLAISRDEWERKYPDLVRYSKK